MLSITSLETREAILYSQIINPGSNGGFHLWLQRRERIFVPLFCVKIINPNQAKERKPAVKGKKRVKKFTISNQ